MKTNLINQLRRHEGLRLKPYQCSGDPPKWTIGFGRNREDNGITQEEAEIMLLNDLKMVEEELNGHVWYDGLSETRQAVLQNMSFNIGFPTLKKFSNFLGCFGPLARPIGRCVDFDHTNISRRSNPCHKEFSPLNRMSKS